MLFSRNTGTCNTMRWWIGKHQWLSQPLASLVVLLATACTPTVQVAPSEKPITINMNIKIEHEIRVKLDKQLEDKVFSEDSGLF